ncbi:hypothetical protein MTR67_003340 [Solanum verrucosum]|uniref:Uncharacterized protein n=1 Tax=Solanum verrucosum TaxID=315347 RepID=A0AAF0TE17_SOLVR|nr:hypothetical protein MTR67_003340 [Solanum verrucosum]
MSARMRVRLGTDNGS